MQEIAILPRLSENLMGERNDKRKCIMRLIHISKKADENGDSSEEKAV